MADPSRFPQAPERIVVLRALRGLGDMLCAIPALRALRCAFPDAHLTLVGLPWATSFAARFPSYIDDVAPMPGFPGIADCECGIEQLPAFFADMHARRFDLAVQMHGSGIVSNPLAVLLGARRTAGFYLPGQWLPDPDSFLPYPAEEYEPRRWLELTSHLGAASDGDHLEFPILPEDRSSYATLSGAAPLPSGPYAVLHPGADDPRRRWPPERFAEVGDAIAERGLEVVLTGTAAERPVAAAVASRMHHPSVDLAGSTDLGALACVVERARLLVSNDTGVSHVAAALRVPSVIVYTGASNHRRWAPIDDRLHRRCVPPDGDGGCGLPVNERCLRDGCTASSASFEPYYAPVQEVLSHVASHLSEEATDVA